MIHILATWLIFVNPHHRYEVRVTGREDVCCALTGTSKFLIGGVWNDIPSPLKTCKVTVVGDPKGLTCELVDGYAMFESPLAQNSWLVRDDAGKLFPRRKK